MKFSNVDSEMKGWLLINDSFLDKKPEDNGLFITPVNKIRTVRIEITLISFIMDG